MPTVAPIDPEAVSALLAPFGSSRTLPAEAYRSHELFAWEQREVFGRTWVCVGRSTDLLEPGQACAVAAAGEEVLVTRDGAGDLRAFSNVCAHRGHPLLEPGEPVSLRQVRCPYHSWAYRFDGSLRSAPTLTQSDDFDPADWSLTAIRLAEWSGWLFVDLSCAAPPVDETFGGLTATLAAYDPERLVQAARHQYEVAANWKLIAENYHECYHCSSIHPALCAVSPPDSGADLVPDGLWCGGTMQLRDHAETMSLDGRSHAARFRRLTSAGRRQVLYVHLLPNLLVSAHPDYVMTHLLTPVSPDLTRIECSWHFAPEALDQPDFDPDYAIAFWDRTNKQDWEACERVQRATGSRGFRPGPLSPWESTIYQLHSFLGRAYRGDGLQPPTYVPGSRRPDTATGSRP